MVVFKVKEDFYSGTMCQIRELRQKGLLCDVTLTVGQDQLPAHRCVLAVASRYFNSLFLGQFKETSMQTVDLSEVTDDVKDLELVVNFMYTGEVDIDENNLGVLVQLSSFFLIAPLREFCTEYMMQNLDLTTCLRYYLIAIMHSLTIVEEVASKMVASRFHDYIIFDENLRLTPDEVVYLLERGIFVHCSGLKLVNFVAVWLKDEGTEKHISVANQLLDQVDMETVVPEGGCGAADRRRMATLTEALQGQRGDEARRLLEKAESIYARIFPETETDSKGYHLRLGSSSAKKETFMDSEEVVVTLSPTQCLMDVSDQNLEDKVLEEPVLDLCCYVPRAKTWYHVRQLKPCETGGIRPLHLLVSDDIVTIMYKEELVITREYNQLDCAEIYFFNIRNKSLRIVECIEEPDEVLLEEDEDINFSAFCFVTDDRSLYLIYKIIICDDNGDVVGEYFKCVRLEEDNRTWSTVFKTDIEREGACGGGYLQAKLSPVSNEMIFICGPNLESGNSYIFVVNMNEECPVPVKVFTKLGDKRDQLLTDVMITQSQSHFYIVQVGVERLNGHVHIAYEYKFKSQSVIKPEREVITFNHLVTRTYHYVPYKSNLTSAGDTALWQYSGNETFASVLAKCETKLDGSMACTVHTPPPFHFMAAMFVGTLPADLLEGATPIHRFLLRGRKFDC